MLLMTQPLLKYIKYFIYTFFQIVSSNLQLTMFSKLHKLLLITNFYPASYLIEENNQLPDLYTIGNLTVYTIVLFAPIVIEAQFCLQWSD